MTVSERQKQKAREFLALHHAPEILVLPNVWDAASLKIFESEGFKAIGATSAGIAAVLGYGDGEKMTLADNMRMVERIAACTSLPVNADIERGYAETAEGVAQSAEAAIKAGAVGVNIEDGASDGSLFDIGLQQEKLQAMREISAASVVDLVINARTDSFLVNDDMKASLREAINRGNAYREAGADCIFVPDMGNLDREAIAVLVNEIDAPINIIAGATTPPIAELQELGVARVSVGPRPMRAVLSLLREIAKELSTRGTYELMAQSSISYADVNQWFDETKGAG